MNFKVLLRGENFRVREDGRLRVNGSYTTRFFEAETPEQAELIAVRLIRDDEAVKGITANAPDDSPMITRRFGHEGHEDRLARWPFVGFVTFVANIFPIGNQRMRQHLAARSTKR